MFKKIVNTTNILSDTTYHSYHEDDRHGICDAVILNPMHKTDCMDCGKICCISCALIKVANTNGYVCNNCIEKREYNKIYGAIASSPILQQLAQTNSTHTVVCNISHFAVGITVKCCNSNKNCDTEININNLLDLKSRMDHLGVPIFFYYPNMFDNINNKIVTRDIYGINTRIFCSLCTMHEIKPCQYPHCETIDTNLSENNVCRVAGHPVCIECGVLENGTSWHETHHKCTICKTRSTCSTCLRQWNSFDCHHCLVSQETNELASILSSIIGKTHKSVAHIIAQYAIGYIVMCCNETDECQRKIILDDKWYFECKTECVGPVGTDFSQQKILYYSCSKTDFNGNVRFLYNSTYRIFCSVCCASGRLKPCDKCMCFEPFEEYHERSGYGYYGRQCSRKLNLCERHPRCDICGKHGEECRSQQMTICVCCKRRFCLRCGIDTYVLCRHCIVDEEVNMFVDTLYSMRMQIVSDINISKIIASYAIGYILQCCNFDFCDKELNILNGYEFHQFGNESLKQVNYGNILTDQKYYHYSVDAAINAEGTFWYIYNHQIRIFCVDCYEKYCKKCAFERVYGNAYSSVCNNFDTMYFCLDHEKCIVCKKWKKSAELSYGYCTRRQKNIYCCESCRYIPDDEYSNFELNELYELSKYDDSECFKKMCKPYSLV